jgi:uncharacterized protein YndB with AHSA1/START domain
MRNEPIVIGRIYNAPAEKVWTAITNKNEMKKWYFDLAEFKPEVGFEFTFTGGEEGGKQFLHLCRITAADPGKKISYTWRYDGYEGCSEVTFELFPEGNTTRLKLTHTGLDTFPAIKEFAKENFVQGWTHITGVSLKEYLEK